MLDVREQNWMVPGALAFVAEPFVPTGADFAEAFHQCGGAVVRVVLDRDVPLSQRAFTVDAPPFVETLESQQRPSTITINGETQVAYAMTVWVRGGRVVVADLDCRKVEGATR